MIGEKNMPGSKIPVLESEKLTLSDDGRGLNLYWDGTNFWSGSMTTISDKSLGPSGNGFLPVSSGSGWLRIQAMSGSNGSIQTGYIPVFRYKCGGL